MRSGESLQQLQFEIGPELAGRIRTAVDLPATPALGLQQEYIVLVDVGANRSPGRRVADHHVVDAPGGQETKAVEQGPDVQVPLVHVLHQQRPVLVSERREFFFGERAAAHLPLVDLALVGDQPG